MIYAMFIVSILTILVGLIAVKARIYSVKNGHIPAGYFKLMQGQDVPEIVTKTTRCFNNLFEIPVLFYIVCTLYIALGIETYVAVVVAWIFAILRCTQAYIHITYNHVKHRMLAFGASVLCVFLLWVNLIALKI
ncbi:MAPEG family protein [Gilvimarinus polysaccharolyticus]|uniref:MAPEG family protein n=1 Tax=Gilvimarinus polysaccharolyticus TaxID=863921 RepID=UPI000673743B|nr:MAPEG family protein [Gilvimarinus polysaccharolyticus]